MPEDLLANALGDQPTPSTRPEDVPEKFWDSEAGQLRVDALLKSYRELERRLSQRIAPPGADAPAEEVQRFRRSLGIPDSPEEYQITPKHDLCCADQDVNKRLHDAGFTPAQAQLVYDLAAERLLPMIAEAAAQFEADRQVEKLREHFGGEERFRRIAQQLSTTSEGVMALYRMMEKGEPAVTRKADAAPIADETALREMMRDPRYWRTREPEFVKRVTDGFRRMVGG
jgi:hypothetical protein